MKKREHLEKLGMTDATWREIAERWRYQFERAIEARRIDIRLLNEAEQHRDEAEARVVALEEELSKAREMLDRFHRVTKTMDGMLDARPVATQVEKNYREVAEMYREERDTLRKALDAATKALAEEVRGKDAECEACDRPDPSAMPSQSDRIEALLQSIDEAFGNVVMELG